MRIDLSRRVALVCGGSRGIGWAAAEALARAGASVVVLSRDPGNVKSACARLRQMGGSHGGITADVSGGEAAERAIDEVQDRFGRLDILVNNAGGPPMGTLDEHSLEVWDEAYHLTLRSFIAFTKTALPVMARNDFGRILNVTSYLAKEPPPAMVISATFRAGVSAMTKAVAKQVASHGITVNTVCPSAVLTDRAKSLTEERAKREGLAYEEALAQSTANIPARRFATLEEMGSTIAFLASDQAGYINGVSLVVDGALSHSTF